MKPWLIVLQKLVVYPFYRDNTGFFFVWAMLLIGLQEPVGRLFTEPFLSLVVQTPVVAVVLAALLLYFIKCYVYTGRVLAQPEQEFLYVTALLPTPIVALSWLLLFGSLYLPALIYLGLLTWSALKLRAGLLVLLLLGYSLVLAGFFIGRYTLINRRHKAETNYNFRLLPAQYSYLLVFSKYIGHEAKSATLVTKLFAVAVISAFLHLYPVAEYGVRPVATGFLMGLAGHSLLVFRVRQFEEERLWLLRQLPWPGWQRLLLPAVTYATVLLPEGVYLLTYINQHFTIFNWLGFYAFGTAFLTLLHGLLYRRHVAQENYFRQLFFLFIGLLFLILFSVPPGALAGLCLGGSILLWRRYYYLFETEL